MKKFTISCIALAMVVGVCLTAEAQNRNQAMQFKRGVSNQVQHWKGKWPSHGHRPNKPHVKYSVELYHPSGGLHVRRVNNTREAAESTRTIYAKYHWRKYKYAGIGEPTRYKGPYTSYSDALNATLPIGIIESQSVVTGRVTIKEIPVESRR